MAKKHLKNTPHNITSGGVLLGWWYEEASGIMIYPGEPAGRLEIPWKALKDAIFRKELDSDVPSVRGSNIVKNAYVKKRTSSSVRSRRKQSR